MLTKPIEELHKDLEFWKPILGVQDWEVVLKKVRHDQLDKESQGNVSIQAYSKKAVIRLLDEIDVTSEWDFPIDHEKTLVHELLHLHFAPFNIKSDTPEEMYEEQAVHKLAKGLVTLRRMIGDRGPEEQNK